MTSTSTIVQQTSLLDAYEQRIDLLETFIRDHSGLFPDLLKRRDQIIPKSENFRHHLRNVDKSIVILLLGGTGTGKSTLINALAGGDISPTSVKRAYTDRYIIYHHQEANTDFLGEVVTGEDEWQVHERDTLLEKIIIDAPDFDSVRQLNRDKVLRMLDLADLVFCVVTSEKYRDLRLFEILAEVGQVKRFLFIYNKIDLDYSEAVQKQLEEELESIGFEDPTILPVSAWNAFVRESGIEPPADRAAGSSTLGEFDRLKTIIHEELTYAEIRAIKSQNLDNLWGRVLEDVESTLPEDLPALAERFRERAEQKVQTTAQRLSEHALAEIFEDDDREIQSLLRSIQYSSFRLVFGLYMTLVDKLKSFRPGYRSIGDLDKLRLRTILRERCAAMRESYIRHQVSNLYDSLRGEVNELGIRDERIGEMLNRTPADAFYRELMQTISDGLLQDFHGLYDQYILRRRGRVAMLVRDVVYNVLPLGFLGYMIYKTIAERVGTPQGAYVSPLSDALITTILFLLLILFIIQIFADRAFNKRTWGFLAGMEGHTKVRVKNALEDNIGQGIKDFCGELLRAQKDLEKIRNLASMTED